MTHWFALIILGILKLSLLTHSPQVLAAPKVSGFINAIGGYATERPTLGYPDDELTFTRDSLVGLQVSGHLAEKISATGQLVARGQEDFAAEAAWAYVTYQLSDAAQFRMGRFRTPLFLYSDFLEVGYAQHWVKPPEEVYALQFNSVDGLEFSQSMSFGRMDTRIQLYFGSAEDEFDLQKQDASFDITLREQMGAIGTAELGWLTVRASFHQVTRLTIENFSKLSLPQPWGDVGQLAATVRTLDNIYGLGADADFVVEHLDVEDVAAEFSEFAVKMQWSHLFIVGEGTLLTFDDSPLAKQRRHLISLGTRFADTTLYCTYARANDDPVDLRLALPSSAQGVNQVLEGLAESLSLESRTSSLGVRHDLAPGAAVKIEVSENEIPERNRSNLVRFGFHLTF